MDYKLLTPVLLSVIVLSLVPVQYAEAHHCSIAHLDDCIKDAVRDAINATVKPLIDDIKKEVNVVKDDVEKVNQKVVAIEKSLGKDLGGIVKDIEKDVTEIEKDAESLEKAVVTDLVTDISDIKKDVKKVDEIAVSVEKIAKKVVNLSEEFVKTLVADFIKDFWYIVYGVVAIGVVYLVIRIIQFAIWLRAYLRQDGIEHNSKKVVEQNDEIIKLLKELLNK